MNWSDAQRTEFQELQVALKCNSCRWADKDAIAHGEPCCTSIRGHVPAADGSCETREEEAHVPGDSE